MNYKPVIARLNDHSSYISGRIVGLSEEASRRIGMMKRGIVAVVDKVMQ